MGRAPGRYVGLEHPALQVDGARVQTVVLQGNDAEAWLEGHEARLPGNSPRGDFCGHPKRVTLKLSSGRNELEFCKRRVVVASLLRSLWFELNSSRYRVCVRSHPSRRRLSSVEPQETKDKCGRTN